MSTTNLGDVVVTDAETDALAPERVKARETLRRLMSRQTAVPGSTSSSDDLVVLTPAEIAEGLEAGRALVGGRALTCADCSRVGVCAWAFDSYNTDDDCLWEK